MCSVPQRPVPVPDVVARIAAGREVTAVWVNDLGGVTFRISDACPEFVKTSTQPELACEATRLRWAGRFIRVPRVLGAGDGWLHTAGLPGRSAVDPWWLERPREAARAIGAGLRHMHDRLPVDECPFDWSVQARLRDLTPRQRVGLPAPPPVDKLVVCHGDACAPNTLIDDDGRFTAHVDLGELGVADRWADLAVATLSLGWNYGSGPWSGHLLDAYGVGEDTARIDYYRRLWEAGDISSR